MIALDASALLAFLFREPGHEQVSAVLDNCCMSTVNLSEVLGRFVRDGHNGQAVWMRLQATSIEFISFTSEQASIAAQLLPHTQPVGLSLGDRACLALALNRDIPAMTADRAWAQLSIGTVIQVIR
ncbi:PIN domain-containing protein [soil metagenome]